jgi:hypothetical protein
MTGDSDDIVARIKAVLPVRWFGDTTPILDSLLYGIAVVWSWAYGLLQTVITQARIATATGGFLDLIAADYFATRIVRASGQSDDSFRQTIMRELLRTRATRPALAAMITDLTGRPPMIFEPARPADTGAWGTALAWGNQSTAGAGGWGSLALPFQCFVTAFRPNGGGIASLNGWDNGGGGWGTGTAAYGNLDMIDGQVTDAEICTVIASVMPASAIAWTRITD